MTLSLTDSDLLLLDALQRDASLSQQELADIAGISKTSCWRRIRELEDEGIIVKRTVLLDAKRLDLNVHVIVSVSMVAHEDSIRKSFETHVENLSEITECFSVSGDWDYLLHVITDSIETYNQFLNGCILGHNSVRSASSSFSLRKVKYTTELPVRSDPLGLKAS